MTITNFINSIDTKLYSRIRASKGDAECRRYLKEHLQKQLPIPEMKSFYCEKQTNLLKQCANECDYCKSTH
jgi:hypothetical protein